MIDVSGKEIIQKHPCFVSVVPDLTELYPDSKFIVMKRDIRDAVASNMKIKRDERYSLKYFVDMYINIFRPFTKWYKNVNVDNILFIQFEELLTDTDRVMSELREFTGLSLDFDPLVTEWDYCRTKEYTTELDGKPIDSSNIGNYKDLLAQEEIETLEKYKDNIQQSFPFEIFWSDSNEDT